MANIKTLRDLTPGTVFDAGPIDVRVLDHMTNGTTLLIADKAVAWRPFSLEPLKTRPSGGSAYPLPERLQPVLSEGRTERSLPGGLRHRRRPDPFREHRGSELVPGRSPRRLRLRQHEGEDQPSSRSPVPEVQVPSGPGRLVVACDPVRRQGVQRAQCLHGRQSEQRPRVPRQQRRPAGFLRGIWNHSGIRRRRSGGRP